MAMNLGHILTLSLFGESHGPAIGVVVDGLPPGQVYDAAYTAHQLTRRKPGASSLATPRKEADEVEILSGLKDGVFTGAPLAAVIRNTDQKSRDYSELERLLRPSHADYPAWQKYGEAFDVRGGGRFSGRLTAPLVFAGSLARKLLLAEGIEIHTHLYRVGPHTEDTPTDLEGLRSLDDLEIPMVAQDKQEAVRRYIEGLKTSGDSTGAAVRTVVTGLPAGVGEPHFDTLEGELAKALFAIGGIKAVSFGLGEGFGEAVGSEVNDGYALQSGKVVTTTNHNGGALGGMTTGMPVVFSVTFKPTPSIAKDQQTVDRMAREETTLSLGGRHDPIIALRGRVVVENLTAFVLYDLLGRAGKLAY